MFIRKNNIRILSNHQSSRDILELINESKNEGPFAAITEYKSIITFIYNLNKLNTNFSFVICQNKNKI
jgi:hypothetical protein